MKTLLQEVQLLTEIIERGIQRNIKEVENLQKEIQIRELLIQELRSVLGIRERPVPQ